MAVLLATDRLARRLLPLAALLQLSLVFPDHAPTRFSVAFRARNLRSLQAWAKAAAEEAAETGEDPQAVAQQATSVLALATALNAHDRRTRGHSERVRVLSLLVAEELELSEDDTTFLGWAALLHDIGKLAVPPEILNKPDRLDDHEWEVLRRHPGDGARIAHPLSAWLGKWIDAIGDHHEKFDGSGYPNGLAGEEIGLAARIVSVTDSFETMTAVRAYKKPMSAAAARAELTRCAGSHFDPRVVRAFLNISLGRLTWKLGLAAWLAQLPLVGSVPRAGAVAARLSRPAGVFGGAAAGVASVVVGLLFSVGGSPVTEGDASASAAGGGGRAGSSTPGDVHPVKLRATAASGARVGVVSKAPHFAGVTGSAPAASPTSGLPESNGSPPRGVRPATRSPGESPTRAGAGVEREEHDPAGHTAHSHPLGGPPGQEDKDWSDHPHAGPPGQQVKEWWQG